MNVTIPTKVFSQEKIMIWRNRLQTVDCKTTVIFLRGRYFFYLQEIIGCGEREFSPYKIVHLLGYNDSLATKYPNQKKIEAKKPLQRPLTPKQWEMFFSTILPETFVSGKNIGSNDLVQCYFQGIIHTMEKNWYNRRVW